MYKIWMTKLLCFLPREHATIQDALLHGRSTGHEFEIRDSEGKAVGFCEGASLKYTGRLH